MREVLVAAALVAAGVMTLGTHWQGVEMQPGVWRDGVSSTQVVVFAGLLVVTGCLAAPHVRSWPRRLIVLLPLLAWLGWQLRHGTLWPIALALYGAGVVFCWLAGLFVGLGLGRWLRKPGAV